MQITNDRQDNYFRPQQVLSVGTEERMNSHSNNHARTKKIAQIAFLSALVVILQLFFSSITIGPVNLSFVLVPIVIAGVFVGPVGGAIVGLIAGTTTVIMVFTTATPFNTMLVSVNPAAMVLICLLKQTAAGFLSGELYKIFSAKKIVAYIIAGAACPIVNTGVFCIGMFIFFTDGLTELFGADAGGIVYIVFILLAGINFIVEFILNVILCPVICKALSSARFVKTGDRNNY